MKEGIETKKAVCVWCKGECGVLVYIKDGHLVKVEGDPLWPRKVYPPIKGCLRRRAAVEWFYHPERVNFPLKRAGEKGGGKWKRISWEEALDEIAEKLKNIKDNYGGETIAYTRGTQYRTEDFPRVRFFQLLGAHNGAGAGHICFIPRSTVANTLVGMFPHFSLRPNTKCIVLLGAEPLVSRPINALTLLEAKKRGAKLIVIDPRRTRSAEMADLWLQLRPGTDGALLLGMIRVMIDEKLYDKDFVDNWCYGFDKLRERIKDYPVEKVASITEVPAEKILAAARLYASVRPGCMMEGMGIEELQDNSAVLQARWILAALAGNIDVEGGEELTGPHPKILSPWQLEPRPEIRKEELIKQIGSDRFKLLTWPGRDLVVQNISRVWGKPAGWPSVAHGPSVYRAMLTGKPYPIKAAVTTASNPMVTMPNTKLIYQALKNLDLYVVMDFWMTPSAELADYVLPVASWLERPILWDFMGYMKYMIAGEAALPVAIQGEYEHKTDYEVFRELGIRLGQEELWPWKNLEEYYDALLKPTGYTLKEYVEKVRCEKKVVKFRKYEEKGFATPTGKVELYSTVLEKLGYDPLPKFKEPSETPFSQPELAREYPLTLITGGRSLEYYHSEWRQIDSVRKRHPFPLLQIHLDTAAALGIKDGDWVWVENSRGRVRHIAKLYDGLKPNVVHAEHGWWLPELPGEEPWLHGVWEVNINVLTDDSPDICDPATGAFPLRTALCKVYKAKNY